MVTGSPVIKSASIIITSFNYAQFIGNTITSALSQTFPNVEVIVVDDGSTDGSLSVIQSFGTRIALIAQENKGAAAAEYAGFVRAKEDLILFLDSDDLLYPTAIEESVALFTADTSKVQFCLEGIDASGAPFNSTTPPKMPREKDIENLVFRFGLYPYPPTSGNAYSRRFLLQVLPCTEPGIGASTDLYAAVLAPLYGRVRVSERVLGGYRIHGRNMCATEPSLPKIRTEVVAFAAAQRALETHCAKFNRTIELGLHWRRPYYCKRRLISLKADRATHPFPKDRLFELAWKGLVATFLSPAPTDLYPTNRLMNRVALVPLFFLLPFLPSRLVNEKFSIFDGGKTRLIETLKGISRSILERARSLGKAPRGSI